MKFTKKQVERLEKLNERGVQIISTFKQKLDLWACALDEYYGFMCSNCPAKGLTKSIFPNSEEYYCYQCFRTMYRLPLYIYDEMLISEFEAYKWFDWWLTGEVE